MFHKFKKIIYFFVGRYTRTRIFWMFKLYQFSWKNKWLMLRSENDLKIANKFNYYWNNLSSKEQEEKRRKLCRNLNSTSVSEVDLFIKRQLYISSHNLLQQADLFTKSEIKEQKECSRTIKKISKMVNNYNFSFLSSECFYGLSGLRWLPKNIINKIQNGTFIDVGAYEGDTAVFFQKTFNLKHIHAFEPDDYNFKILQENCHVAGHGYFTLIKAALSNNSGTTYFNSQGGESHITYKKNNPVVKTIKLDDYWEQNHKNNKISLIKLDIEGAEIAALEGMKNIIQKQFPVLAISIYHRPEDFFNIKPWLENLCPQYKYIIKKASPFSLTGETMLLAFIE